MSARATPQLETPEQRLSLPVKPNGYSIGISPGFRLNYRRSARTSGTWSILVADGKGSYSMRRIAIADDIEPADGVHIMDYQQAKAATLATARAERKERG